MSETVPTQERQPESILASDESTRSRQRVAGFGRAVLFTSLLLGLIALVTIFLNVLDKVGGYAVYGFKIDPLTITPSRPFEELPREELLRLAKENVPADRLEFIPEDYGAPLEELSKEDLINVLYNETPFPEKLTALSLEELSQQQLIEILQRKLTTVRFDQLNAEKPLTQRSEQELIELIETEILLESVLKQWFFFESLFRGNEIIAEIERDYPGAEYDFKWWLTPQFVISPQASRPETTGLRTALIGSVFIVILTLLIAVPVGVAAGTYLEEFAGKSRLGEIIQTNIYNLAGVPSIIYGMLGLAVFARALSDFTTGA
ncbi:MAG: hypothetical protein NZ693_09540, partial [Thermoflexales bacterium]|nr:hypothetical protein [Thermoflexales bacterium]